MDPRTRWFGPPRPLSHHRPALPTRAAVLTAVLAGLPLPAAADTAAEPADTGDTGAGGVAADGVVTLEEAWALLEPLLAERGFEPEGGGEPDLREYRSASQYRLRHLLRLVLDETPGGLEALVADPAAAAEDRALLEARGDGTCAEDACAGTPGWAPCPICGARLALPAGPWTGEPTVDLGAAYATTLDAFLAWAGDQELFQPELIGCGCTTLPDEARRSWQLLLAATVGLALLRRRRVPPPA